MLILQRTVRGGGGETGRDRDREISFVAGLSSLLNGEDVVVKLDAKLGAGVFFSRSCHTCSLPLCTAVELVHRSVLSGCSMQLGKSEARSSAKLCIRVICS